MNGHAPKGGCIGVNGEFYEGGKFLPSNAHRPKGMSISRGVRKIEIEPYKWITYSGELKEGEKADGFYNLISETGKRSYMYYGKKTEAEYEEYIKPFKEAWNEGKRIRIFKQIKDGKIIKGFEIIRFEEAV